MTLPTRSGHDWQYSGRDRQRAGMRCCGCASGAVSARQSLTDIHGMVYFYVRGPEHRLCEVRLNPHGPGFELVVEESDRVRVEWFETLPLLRAREHEILTEWRAHGWREPARLRTRTDHGMRPRQSDVKRPS
jgi:DNA segregation ATPase FtsK/SpoIIIE-like protein